MLPSAVTLIMFMVFSPTAIGQDTPSGPLVSAEWLKEHLYDTDQVILHVAFNRREFSNEHIPGAQFVWWNRLVPSTPDFSSELPSLADAQELLRSVGVNKTSRIIVVFGRTSITSGTRPLWTLLYYGLGDRSYLLDGGMEAWKRVEGPITSEVVVPAPGNVTLSAMPVVMADAEYIKGRLNDPMVAVVDARSKIYFDGRSAGQPKAGHISGAVSIPYSEVVDSLMRFKPTDELKRMFDEAGVRNGSTVVTYCHVGQQATVTLLAARLLGYPVRLYDGSFEDWSYQDDSFPVVIPQSEKE